MTSIQVFPPHAANHYMIKVALML